MTNIHSFIALKSFKSLFSALRVSTCHRVMDGVRASQLPYLMVGSSPTVSLYRSWAWWHTRDDESADQLYSGSLPRRGTRTEGHSICHCTF